MKRRDAFTLTELLVTVSDGCDSKSHMTIVWCGYLTYGSAALVSVGAAAGVFT